MYNDPSGEFIGIVFGAIKIISAVLSAIQIVKSVDALVTGRMDVFQFAKGLFFMVVSKVVSAGVGEIFKAGDVVKALGDYTFIAQSGVHAASQSLLSTMQGGNFGNTFWKSLGTNLALHGLGMISASKNSSKNGTEGGNITQSDSKNAEIISASEDRVSGETRLEELVVSKQKGYWGSKIYAHVNNSISDLNVYQSRMRLANAIYNSNVAQSIGNFEQFLFSEIPGWFLGGVPIGRVGGIAVGGTKLAAKGGIANSRALGIAGEQAVGVGSKTRIPSLTGTAKYRIPDQLTSTTLGEVKNVSHLSLTRQLTDFHMFSQQTGRQFILYTRPNTTFSGPLQNLINNGSIIKPIPFK